jgi:hypothetical protein
MYFFQSKLVDLESLEADWYRDTSLLVDVFEPSYIRAALTEKPLVLGSLIFGQDNWFKLKDSISTSSSAITDISEDPLTSMFRRRGVLCCVESLSMLIFLLMW